MEIDLDFTGRRALVVGDAAVSRRAIARLKDAGATVWVTGADGGDPSLHPVALPRHASAWRQLISGVDVVVVVELSANAETMLRSAARGLRTWIVHEAPAATSRIGHVTLVGGGPGDESLLTIAGRDALLAADVVLFDRLAPLDALARWAPGAELVDVGKTPGHHAVPQREIEKLMVDAALAGRTVVRLKGGDPFVFGRGSEEVAACREAGVPVSVISGVTSAIAVPAAAGIPVTHREISRMFTVVSGHAPLDDETVQHLVGLAGTIVVLMGVNTLPHLTAALVRCGASPDLPVAVVERGLTPTQRTTFSTLANATQTAAQRGVRSPAVLVIGEVVRWGHDEDAARALHDIVALAAGT